jgi:ribosomal protein S18 acetylase RimI-like enzyme
VDFEGFSHSGRLGMGVLSAYWGQGIGSALLEKTLAVARERNLEQVELEFYASNAPAIRLYEKFRFQTEGRKSKARKIDGKYDDLVLMALVFDPSAAQASSAADSISH